MGTKSKPGKAKVRSAAHKPVGKPASRRGRREGVAPDLWTAQVADERDDEIDCQRIVEGYGGRLLPPYFDEYN